MALLVQNMERLNEQVKEEADGVYNTLGEFAEILFFFSDMLFFLICRQGGSGMHKIIAMMKRAQCLIVSMEGMGCSRALRKNLFGGHSIMQSTHAPLPSHMVNKLMKYMSVEVQVVMPCYLKTCTKVSLVDFISIHKQPHDPHFSSDSDKEFLVGQ